jgi:glutamyl-tRNA reductase
MVVGETQILGQLKDTLKFSKDSGVAVSKNLEQVFNLAFQTAKRIRTETSIAEKPVSIASIALRRIQELEVLHPLEEMVLVGRSPIVLSVLQWVKKNRPSCKIRWVNRSLEALTSYPESKEVECDSLLSFLQSPREFSHLVTATSSREPVFGESFFNRLIPGQRVLVDLAQPQDIEGSFPREKGILLHLEDFQIEASENIREREKATLVAETIIDESIQNFLLEQKEAPLLKEFSSVENIIEEQLSLAMLSLGEHFPGELKVKVEKWAEKLVKRNLYSSREHLKNLLRKNVEEVRS